MTATRWRLAHIAILSTACVLVSQQSIRAQQTVEHSLPEVQSDTPCSSSGDHDGPPLGPTISIVEVAFSGFMQIPVSDQEQIAESIKQQTHGTSLDKVTDEALWRAKAEWLNRGYFKVQVSGDAKTLTSNPANRIALSVHVNEGAQYQLKEITFKNNKAISSLRSLRGMFPIEDGDIFSREKIAKGLENLRKAYGDFGYINFVSVPNTQFDDENKQISLEIEMDEGKQFYVSGITVLGLDESAREELSRNSPIKRGQIYNRRLWELLLSQYASQFPNCGCRHNGSWRLDERSGTVALMLDFRPCSSN